MQHVYSKKCNIHTQTHTHTCIYSVCFRALFENLFWFLASWPSPTRQEFGWWLIVISFLVFKVDWRSLRNASSSVCPLFPAVSSPMPAALMPPFICCIYLALHVRYTEEVFLINFNQWMSRCSALSSAAVTKPSFHTYFHCLFSSVCVLAEQLMTAE